MRGTPASHAAAPEESYPNSENFMAAANRKVIPASSGVNLSARGVSVGISRTTWLISYALGLRNCVIELPPVAVCFLGASIPHTLCARRSMRDFRRRVEGGLH